VLGVGHTDHWGLRWADQSDEWGMADGDLC